MMMRMIFVSMILCWGAACASTGGAADGGSAADDVQTRTSHADSSSTTSAAEASPGVAFTTSRTTFVRNDRIGLTVVNNTDSAIGYDLCYTRIEMKVEGSWHVAEDYPDFCDSELRVLEPGKSADYNVNMGEVLPAGQYRVLTEVEIPQGGARQTLYTVELELRD